MQRNLFELIYEFSMLNNFFLITNLPKLLKSLTSILELHLTAVIYIASKPERKLFESGDGKIKTVLRMLCPASSHAVFI